MAMDECPLYILLEACLAQIVWGKAIDISLNEIQQIRDFMNI